MFKSIIESLQYLLMTKLDLSFIVNKLSEFVKSPTRVQWQACKRILSYVKGTLDYGLVFKPIATLSIEIYIDAD